MVLRSIIHTSRYAGLLCALFLASVAEAPPARASTSQDILAFEPIDYADLVAK